MAIYTSSWAIQPVRPAAITVCPDVVGDAHLLDRFIDQQDETAFAELVRRHARMVLGVCQRVLGNSHDAEDCFQAAFLVLVRKATTIRPREMVGNWLYGVAYRTALEAKKMAARRRNRERKKFDMARFDADANANPDRWQELKPLLDAELNRLPDKYRHVLIACDIEGRTRKDVAHALDVPEGTVASRLARARMLLAKRLSRRGFAITAPALAAMVADKAPAAFVSPELANATTNAAAALAAGKSTADIVSSNVAALMSVAVRSLLWTKLQVASAVLMVLIALGLGVGALLPPAIAGKNNDEAAHVAPRGEPERLTDCVVHAIDPETMTIQAARFDETDGGATKLREFVVKPSSIIIVEGRKASFFDLKAGDCVTITVERGARGKALALSIESTGEVAEGIVEARTEESVDVTSNDGATHKLNPGAWVFVNGKKAKVGDLKQKMKVALYKPAGKPGYAVVAAAGPKVAVTLKKVDGKKLSMTLPDTSVHAEAIVAADALVWFDDRRGKLSELRPGMTITLQMSAATDATEVIAILGVKK